MQIYIGPFRAQDMVPVDRTGLNRLAVITRTISRTQNSAWLT